MNKQTVLVVDDTPENIHVLANVLKPLYLVKAAKSGEDALRLASMPRKPDLILLDVMMPKMNGYEVCQKLKADPLTEHIPVIFVTAKSAVQDEIRGFEMGAVDYITKPISPPVVLSRVKTHLSLHNQNIELDRKVREKTQELANNQMKVIQRLGRAAEYKDNETGMHVIRVGHYTRILALACGMNESDAETFMAAAPMHDVGKIGIPDSILQKNGRLSADEWDVMKTHVDIGVKILGDDSSPVLRIAQIVALSHHEKWDGSGYPNGLSGETIPLAGRIVAIADVFDALISERPYKKAWPLQDAIALLKKDAGSHFDPNLVPLFINSLNEILMIKEKFKD